jgi:hypothetical protein
MSTKSRERLDGLFIQIVAERARHVRKATDGEDLDQSLWFSDDRAERDGARPSRGDANDPDHDGGLRYMAARALGSTC